MSPMSPRLLRPRATGFSPKQIAGLVGWWDFSDATQLRQTTAGATGVTSDGTSVGYVLDKSGNSRPMAATADARRPIYKASILNGRGGLRFDGVDDVIGATTHSGTAPETQTWFGVFSNFIPVAATSKRFLCRSDAASLYINPTTPPIVDYWSRTSTTYGGIALANAVFSANYESASLCVVRQNGAVQINVTGPNAAYTTDTSLLAGASTLTGANAAACDCQEILIWHTSLTTSQRQQVEGYLAWKYGLQATLPYDHPYAASFPGYGTQATPSDADALAYLSAVRTADGGTGVEVGVANAVDSFVKGCKSDGTWSAIKASCILAGARTLSGALVPLAGTAPTNNGFVAADYNRKTGLIGDASTKWLDTNRNNNADPQDSKHLAVWRTAAASNDAGLFGSNGTSTGDSHIYTGFGSFNFRNNAATSATQLLTLMTGEGFLGTSRAAADSFSYRIGTTSYTAAVASQAPRSANLRVFETGTRTNARLAFYSAGESLNLASLGTRVARLMAEAQYNLNTGLSGRTYSDETLAYINAGYAAGGTLA